MSQQYNSSPLSDQPFKIWRYAVDRRMKSVYGITIADAGIDEDDLKKHWSSNELASNFVEWFGNKYDLDRQLGLLNGP